MPRIKKAPPDQAEQVRLFFERCLTHHKGELAGKPFILADWQYESIIKPLFGTKGKDGTRQYRTCYIEVPRKNGKSTLAAGVALYLLFADGEPGAEVVSAAADREQARIVFDLAVQMVQASPVLKARSTIYRTHIETRNGGRYKAISSEAYTKHGLNLSGIIFDEVHAQPDRELWEVLATSTGARRQPLTFAITTAGFDRSSLCWDLHTYSKNILEGTAEDPTFLPVLYGASQEDDWTAPATWKKANPGYGVSIKPEYFSNAITEAKANPSKEQSFRRLHLCQWTESSTRWLNMDRWDSCQEEEWPDLEGATCYAGLDLSATLDLTSLALAFPVDDSIYVLSYSWAPKGALHERERRNRSRIEPWAARGHIEITDGDVIDYERVTAKLLELSKRYRIAEVAIDRWNAAATAQTLQAQGLEVIAFGQGYASMSPAAKDFEALVMAGKLRHDGNPVLRWSVGNVVIEQDSAGNIKPSKAKSTEKIDAAIASIMAVARARIGHAGGGTSVYEARGLSML